MKDFFRNKKKFLLVVMLMVVTLTGCSVPRGQNGKTYVNSIYTNNDVQVKRGDVDIPDDKELQKKYKDYKADDLITIEKTTFSDAMDEGWFNGLIVWPIAFLINFVADFSDAGIGIIAATFLIQLLIFLFSIKSQVASQRMQSIQPEMNKIQAKYAGKTDDRSKDAAGAGNAGALQQIQNQSVWNTAGNVYTVPGNSGYVSGDDARVQRGNRFLPGNQPG